MKYTLLFLILWASQAMAINFNDAVKMMEYHHEDGLPNDLVKDLMMDGEGFIWVSTDDGLVKIEGREFLQIPNPEMFSNNYKQLLYSEKFGIVATADPGLVKYDQQHLTKQLLFFKDYYKITNWPKITYPKSLFQDSNSNLWVADLNFVYRINSEKAEKFSFDPKNFTTHFSRSYQFFEHHENLFVLSQKGYLYRYSKGEFTEVKEYPFKDIEVYSIEPKSESQFLIGTEQGLLQLSLNENSEIVGSEQVDFGYPVSVIKKNGDRFIAGTWTQGAYIIHFNEDRIITKPIEETTHRTINDILIDKDNQLWFGTNDGVILLRKVFFNTPFNNIVDKYIQDVKKSKQGDLFFSDGHQVFRIGKDGRTVVFFYSEDYLTLRLLPQDNGVWMSTNKGKLIFKKMNGSTEVKDFSHLGNGIYSLIKDKTGHLWFIQSQKEKQALYRLSGNGELTDFTPNKISNESSINSLHLSPNGECYLAGTGKNSYLYHFNSVSEEFVPVGNSANTVNNTPFTVYDVTFLSEEQLVLATSHGLYHFNDETLAQIDLGDMTNEMVTAVAIDKKKRIWLANSNGIALYHNNEINVFDTKDGLPSKTTNYQSLLLDENDVLWVGTITGLAAARVKYQPKITPKPVMVKMESGGVPINHQFKNRFLQSTLLQIRLATPSYPARFIKYRYSLSNQENGKWQYLFANQDEIILSDLNPGKYTLKVSAKGQGHSQWSKPLVYNLKIYEVWYKRPLVLIAMYLSIFVLIIIYLTYAKNKSIREKNKLESIIEERTQSMQEKNEELIQLNSELAIAKHKAEEAIKSKDRFFSILAHDLKSPFNTLIGFSELLVYNRDDMSDESMNQFLKEMLKTSENTYKLIQNLLEWARSQTGTLKIYPEVFMVKELVNEVLKVILPMARQKDLQIKTNIHEDITIYADVPMVATVLRNLLSNAIKYSFPNKSIMVEAKSKGGKTEVSVIDFGVGIKSDKINDLFKIDSNISTKGTNDEKGTGLGLVLCKEFVEHNHGDISVESTPGQGSRFTFALFSKKPE